VAGLEIIKGGGRNQRAWGRKSPSRAQGGTTVWGRNPTEADYIFLKITIVNIVSCDHATILHAVPTDDGRRGAGTVRAAAFPPPPVNPPLAIG